MIRLNPQRRVHIPNRLALLGALVLAASLLVSHDNHSVSDDSLAARDSDTAAEQASETAPDSVSGQRRVSLSRLLFGHR